MSYRRNYRDNDSDFPIHSRGLALMGAFRRPAVQTIEKFDKETQGAIPFIKCLGAGIGAFAFLAGLATLIRIMPVSWMENTKDMAWAIGWFAVFCASAFAMYLIFTHRPWSFMGVICSTALYFTIEYFGNLGHDWWASYYWTVIASNALIGVMVFGVVYAYWNIKETINPFELTGFDRVLFKVMKPFLPEVLKKEFGLDDAEITQLQRENEELRAVLDDRQSMPLISTDTYAGRLARAEYQWQLGVAQFLFIGAFNDGGFSRSKWVNTQLPCGLEMTDGLWRYLCAETTGELRQTERDVLVKDGRRTVLNETHEPDELLRMAQEAKLPERMKPK